MTTRLGHAPDAFEKVDPLILMNQKSVSKPTIQDDGAMWARVCPCPLPDWLCTNCPASTVVAEN